VTLLHLVGTVTLKCVVGGWNLSLILSWSETALTVLVGCIGNIASALVFWVREVLGNVSVLSGTIAIP
jgi:hypothetical protein